MSPGEGNEGAIAIWPRSAKARPGNREVLDTPLHANNAGRGLETGSLEMAQQGMHGGCPSTRRPVHGATASFDSMDAPEPDLAVFQRDAASFA